MFAWFKRTFGKGSRIDALVRALPNPDRIIAGADAWASTLVEWGDKIESWDAAESRLVDVIRATADAADWAGPLIGGDIIGDDKRIALSANLRRAAAALGIADSAYDLAWRTKFRPLLESYIEKLRG